MAPRELQLPEARTTEERRPTVADVRIPSAGDSGSHAPEPVEERELSCPACGYCWYADGREERGFWEPMSEEGLYCPECGVEGEACSV